MHRCGQAPAVYPVGRIKKFLESAGIQQTYQEIEAGVVVRDEGKDGDRVEVKVNDNYSYFLEIRSIDKTGSEDEEIRGFW